MRSTLDHPKYHGKLWGVSSKGVNGTRGLFTEHFGCCVKRGGYGQEWAVQTSVNEDKAGGGGGDREGHLTAPLGTWKYLRTAGPPQGASRVLQV